jgi:ribosomal protein L13E
MKHAKGFNEAATLLATGPIDLVGHGAEPRLTLGYSTLELERAGLTLDRARELGLPIDTARTTGVGANVMRLRQLILQARANA